MRARNGTGSVTSHKTIDGTVYGVRITLPGGRRHYKGGFTTAKEARDYGDAIGRSRNADGMLRQRTLKLPELVDMWMQDTQRAKTGATLVGQESCLRNHIRPHLDIPVDKVSAKVLAEFYVELLGRLPKSAAGGRSTYKRVVDMVKATLRWANRPDVRIIEENPLRDVPIKLPKANSPRHSTTPEDFMRLMEATEGKQSRMIWFMLGYTGARMGEVTALLWDDVDFIDETISISKISTTESKGKVVENRVKMGQVRDIPMEPELSEALMEMKQEAGAAGTDPIFPAPRKGGTIGFGTIDKWWVRDCEAAGIKQGRGGNEIHSLRHMFTTLTIEAGADVNVVSQILGHASTAVTQSVYQHISTGQKRKATGLMGGALKKKVA